jgi:hypothetical protein
MPGVRKVGRQAGRFRSPLYCQGYCEFFRPANASPQIPTGPAHVSLVLLQCAGSSALLLTKSSRFDMTLQYTMASTPSDRRATKNAIAALRRKENEVTYKFDQKPDLMEGQLEISAVFGMHDEAHK